MSLTKEDKQTHADGQDGARTQGRQMLTSDLTQFTTLTFEPIVTPAAETVHR